MNRYIDADALVAYIQHYACIPCKEYGADKDGVRCEFCGFGFCLDGIKRHKVTEVVRCRDCKYASPNGEYGCKAYHFKLYETYEMKADDFCSHGERREDDKKRS